MVDVSAMDDDQIEELLVAKRSELEKKYGTLKVGQCFFRNLLRRLQGYYPDDEFVLRIPLFIGTTSTQTTTVFEGMLMETNNNNNVNTVKTPFEPAVNYTVDDPGALYATVSKYDNSTLFKELYRSAYMKRKSLDWKRKKHKKHNYPTKRKERSDKGKTHNYPTKRKKQKN